MLVNIGLGLVAIVILLLVAIATRPAEFRLERSATIAAPAKVVFARLNAFHLWKQWSPWERLDPIRGESILPRHEHG